MRRSLIVLVLAVVFAIPVAFGEPSDRMLELVIRLDRHEDMGMAAVASCNREMFQAVRQDWWETIREIREERKKPDISDPEDLDDAFIYSLDRYHRLRVDYAKACTPGNTPAPPEIAREIVSPDVLKAEMEPLMSEIRFIVDGAANPCMKKERLENLRQQLDGRLQRLKGSTDTVKNAAPLSRLVRYYDLAYDALDLRNRTTQTLQECP